MNDLEPSHREEEQEGNQDDHRREEVKIAPRGVDAGEDFLPVARDLVILARFELGNDTANRVRGVLAGTPVATVGGGSSGASRFCSIAAAESSARVAASGTSRSTRASSSGSSRMLFAQRREQLRNVSTRAFVNSGDRPGRR